MFQRIFSLVALSAVFGFCLTAMSPAQATTQTPAPPTDEEVQAAIATGVQKLLASQENYDLNQDPRAKRRRRRRRGRTTPTKKPAESKAGSKSEKISIPGREWPYEGVYRIQTANGMIPIPPGYRVGGTAIVTHALIEVAGFKDDSVRQAAVARGFAFMLESLETEPLMASGFKDKYDVRGWGHAYALNTFLRALELELVDKKSKRRVERQVKTLIRVLEETEIGKKGGWNYARYEGDRSGASPFMTAPTIQFLMKAKKMGYSVKKGVVERAIATLEAGRLEETGAYQYSVNPGRKTGEFMEHPAGACARMSAAEATLMLAGKSDIDRVRNAVQAFFKHWDELKKRHQGEGTHTRPYGIAPYYFYYAHTYVGQAIEMLPEAERAGFRSQLREILWRTLEKDKGTWNDRIFERSASYGTAMSILALLSPQLPSPAGWKL